MRASNRWRSRARCLASRSQSNTEYGVSRTQADPLAASREGEARFTQDRGQCQLSGLTLEANLAEPDLKVADGSPLGQHGQAPVAMVKQPGKGTAVLVNLFLDSYSRRRERHGEEPLRQLVENLLRLVDRKPAVRVTAPASPPPHFYTVRYRSGGAEYVAVQLEAGADQKPGPLQASISFPRPAFVYDVRTGEALGQKAAVTARLEPGDTKLYALLPYEVKGVTVNPGKGPVRRGEVLPYQVGVRCSGQPGIHVFHVKVIGPDGKERPHYGTKLSGPAGSAVGAVPLALNDPPGQWTLRAWDVATKRMGTTAFQVAP
jgi:hypothetical protein